MIFLLWSHCGLLGKEISKFSQNQVMKVHVLRSFSLIKVATICHQYSCLLLLKLTSKYIGYGFDRLQMTPTIHKPQYHFKWNYEVIDFLLYSRGWHNLEWYLRDKVEVIVSSGTLAMQVVYCISKDKIQCSKKCSLCRLIKYNNKPGTK